MNGAAQMMDYFGFLEQIKANNNRPWLAEHRQEYDALREQWMMQLQQLISAMAAWEPGMARIEPKNASYRFYRDTRFSTDKSPFKCFFSASLSPYGKKSPLAAYYIQLDPRPEENGLYCGLWMPDGPMLKKLRHAIVDNIDEWEEALSAPGMEQWGPWLETSTPPLKTAPAGWPKDHPQIEYLRMRSFGKWIRCDRSFFNDPSWQLKASEAFEKARPMIDFINYSLLE